MTVLVAGASGLTGGAALAQLVDSGVEVRVLARSVENATRLSATGADVAVAAFSDADGLRRAFVDVTSAYLVTPSAPDMAQTEAAFALAAADVGAHLVKLSVIGASVDSPLRFARHHAESEAAIESIGGSWTFLQPTGFMQNDLAWAAQVASGTIAAPVLDAAWSIVDVRDVAAVAAAVLREPAAFVGRRLALTGPEARTPRDRIRALASALGRDLLATDVPVADARQQMLSYGMDEWSVDGIGELLDLYATGAAQDVSTAAEEVLARPPRRWDEFVLDHLHHFR